VPRRKVHPPKTPPPYVAHHALRLDEAEVDDYLIVPSLEEGCDARVSSIAKHIEIRCEGCEVARQGIMVAEFVPTSRAASRSSLPASTSFWPLS